MGWGLRRLSPRQASPPPAASPRTIERVKTRRRSSATLPFSSPDSDTDDDDNYGRGYGLCTRGKNRSRLSPTKLLMIAFAVFVGTAWFAKILEREEQLLSQRESTASEQQQDLAAPRLRGKARMMGGDEQEEEQWAAEAPTGGADVGSDHMLYGGADEETGAGRALNADGGLLLLDAAPEPKEPRGDRLRGDEVDEGARLGLGFAGRGGDGGEQVVEEAAEAEEPQAAPLPAREI